MPAPLSVAPPPILRIPGGFPRVAAWPGRWLVRIVALVLAFAGPRALALKPDEKPVNYTVAHWDTEDGLPHNSIKQLFQTRDGYLWIGTQQGLARFDGLSFTIFTRHDTPALPNNQITSMAETADGSLWIGTAFGLARYCNRQFTSYGRADGLTSDTINAVCVAPDGSLWIGGRNGVIRWVGGRFINDLDTSAYNTLGLRTIMVDREKSVWLAVGSEALRYRHGAFEHFGRAEGLPSQQLQMLREDAAGQLLAVTQNGLFRFDSGHFVPVAENAALSSPRVGTTLVDRSGNLWVGSVSGLDRINGAGVTPYVDRYGHRLGVVDALLEGREGCLWAGTSEGLYRLTDRRAYSLGQEDGVSGNLVVGLKQTRDGSLWISSWGGGVDRIQDGAVAHFAVGAPLSHETVTTIYEAPDGTMWLGNRGSALDRLAGGRVTTYVYPPGVATSRPVTSIFADDDGRLLVGISKRGLLQLHDGQLLPVPEAAALSAATVWTLYRAADGRFFMGTSDGLFQRAADRSWQPIPLPGIPSPVIVRDFLETDGAIWLATEGQGLVRWQNGAARAYSSRDGMVDDVLFSVLDDDHGSLWVSSARGLARVRKSEFAAIDRGAATTLDVMTFGRGDGLQSGSTSGLGSPSAIRATDGRILTATDKGVAAINPDVLQTNPLPPTVVIESVAADDEQLPFGREIPVAAGVAKLEIRYTALSLIAPQRLRFRYQLEGSDPRWVEADHDRRAHYTHLSPGRYTFRVIASNSDGVWNATGTTLVLVLQPHFYQTTWFAVAVVAGWMLGLAAFIRLRMRALLRRQEILKRANAELDQRVQDRTAQISRFNEELQQRELLFRLIFEHAPVGIFWKRSNLGNRYHFNSTFRRILDLPAETPPDYSPLTALIHPEDAARQAGLSGRIDSGAADSYTVEQRYVRRDGAVVWGLLAVAVVRDAHGRVVQDIGILEDVTGRKRAEQELADTYKQLVDVSRTAGMAEVATGVLHNVGNVLNSLNVSANVIASGIQQSRAESLTRLSALLQGHESDLADFLTRDPKGRRVPEFIASLAEHAVAERERLLQETASLQQNVDHIKEIVSMQQAYATVVGVIEALDPAVLMEDALRMNAGSLARHAVRLARDFATVPHILAEKAKVIQILINLIRNAKYACDESGRLDKLVTLRIVPAAPNADRVQLTVQDNGVGIAPENLTRIFAHGFTTRKSGHGFGLHSAANAAREMKGTLTVASDGPGRGATFTLELPALTAAMVSPHEDVPVEVAASSA